jgi:hypothetical protein
MTPATHELIELVEKLDEQQRQQVLDYVRQLAAPTQRFYTVRELSQMSPKERQRHILAAFEAAKDEDFEIFEAYSEEDLE